MLVIEATKIAEGGGGVLLRYLLKSILAKGHSEFKVLLSPTFTIDFLPDHFVERAGVSLLNRKQYFRKVLRDHDPDVIFCFGNFPPPIDCGKAHVITYFHRSQLTQRGWNKEFNLTTNAKYLAIGEYLRLLLPHTDKVLLQSNSARSAFLKKFSIGADQVLLYPFYDDAEITAVAEQTSTDGEFAKVADRFIYVSNTAPHKNHSVLLQAWRMLAERNIHPELQLTIPAGSAILEEVELARQSGARIENLGFRPLREVLTATARAAFCIFPSKQETLGLGLVEAARLGCKVIAADLPYTYSVVKPSAVFNDRSASDITDVVTQALNDPELPESQILLDNRIDDLIAMLFSVPSQEQTS